MTHPYDNGFAEDNVYGHAAKLLGKFELPEGGIHLDFGCGFGSIAETMRDRLGLRYIGLDILESGLDSLKERGFEVLYFDLFDPEAGCEVLDKWIPAGVPVVSMSFLDTMEHLAEPDKALQLLRQLAKRYGCPLVLSVPNVGHRDIGFRLLASKFEYTESGLLDHTHYQYFTEQTLTDRMARWGWQEIYKNDVLMEASDQNFPPDQPLLSNGTPINAMLRYLRGQSESTDTVNQFVRVYVPSAPVRENKGADDSAPFLTVVTRTQGQRIASLRETLLCLSAQSDQDFEVLIVGHCLTLEQQLRVERVIADQHASMRAKTRLVKVEQGERAAPLNAAFSEARGRYVAMLDDDDLVFGHWVETFKKIHERNPGKLLRATAVSQKWDKIPCGDNELATRCKSGFKSEYPDYFDLFDHLIENRSPLHSLAFPRSTHSDLGFRFDESLTTAEDWDYIIRTAPLTGVAESKEVTCVYRRWENVSNSATVHSEHEWKENYQHTLRKVDSIPLLLPVGYTRRVRELVQRADRLRHVDTHYQAPTDDVPLSKAEADYLEALRWRLHELTHSRSWRYTAWIRNIRYFLAGRKPAEIRIWRYTARDLEYLIQSIENSSSWRYTSFLRRSGFPSRK
jgi:glycosyltransferase involved in cell wall biosynthesis/ubiquinone/menaquinone biosynthesis C-methylase UbiE